MLLKLIRFLKGYVTFTAIGRFPERFINLLNQNGIAYFNMLPVDKGYSASMPLQDYFRIRKIAHRCRMRLRVESRVGLPFLMKSLKPHGGVLIGAVCGIVIMSTLSQFIWVIDIRGIDSLSDVQVKTALSNAGLKVGSYRGNIDVGSVKRRVMMELNKIGWMSINSLNNVATVEIREKRQKPELKVKKKYPCNLKASCDGVITSSKVSQGKCLVKKGTAVARNQLLVSSVIEGQDERIRYVHSAGEIYADVIETKCFKINLKDDIIFPEKNYTEKTNLNFLGFSLPCSIDFPQIGDKAQSFHTGNLIINDLSLPLGTTSQREYPLVTGKGTLTENAGREIIQKKIKLFEAFCYRNAEIKSREITYKMKDNILTAKAKYVVNKNIAKEQKIIIRKKNRKTS